MKNILLPVFWGVPPKSLSESMHGGALTVAPGVGGHGPILQPRKQVLRAVLQAEDGLHAWAFAGQQALRPHVHAAVDGDAGEGTGRGGNAGGDRARPQGSGLAIAPKDGRRRCELTCHPATPGTRWDAGMWGAVRWSVGVPGYPVVPPRPPRGYTPCTAPVKPPGRTSLSVAWHG